MAGIARPAVVPPSTLPSIGTNSKTGTNWLSPISKPAGLACGLSGANRFCQPRAFTEDEFKAFMLAQSQPYPEALAFIAELARSGQYLLATLNNESKELNDYRIERFHLRDYFALFFSSCFLGIRKPDEKIYRLALDVIQRGPEECLFVDDRTLNVNCARRLGMRRFNTKT